MDLNPREYVVLALVVATLGWIWFRLKEQRMLASLFPVFVFLETLFVSWRWGRAELFEGPWGWINGGMPSFLIAIGFPFIGFFFSPFLSSSIKSLFNKNLWFPFANELHLSADQQKSYFKWGLMYSLATLLLNEATQIWGLSSRNTFDWVDIGAIFLGSLISIFIFFLLKKRKA